MDFPSSPTVGQTHTIGGKTWEWTGTTWDLLSISETQVQRAEQAAVDAQESAAVSANAALNTPLTGLNTSTVGDVTSTDTTLTAFGKVQARLASILTAIGLLAPKENPTFTGTVSGVTKDMVGLGNVDNTSDIDKPVSTAQGEAIQEVRDDLAADTGAAMVGFKQTGTGAVERTLADKAREIVSVKDFGAVGDGVTDDTAAVSALAGAAEAAGTTGRFGPGVFSVVTPVSAVRGGAVCGDGRYSTVIKRTGDQAGLKGTLVNDTEICNLTLDLQHSITGHSGHGIHIEGSDVHVRRVNVKDFGSDGVGGGTGVLIAGSDKPRNCRLDDCTIEGNPDATLSFGWIFDNTDVSFARSVLATGVVGYAHELKNDAVYNNLSSLTGEFSNHALAYGQDTPGIDGADFNVATGVISKGCDGGVIVGEGTHNVFSGVVYDQTGAPGREPESYAVRFSGQATGNAAFGVLSYGSGVSESVYYAGARNYVQVAAHDTAPYIVKLTSGSGKNATEVVHPGLRTSILSAIQDDSEAALDGADANPVWCHATGERIGSISGRFHDKLGTSGAAFIGSHRWRKEHSKYAIESFATPGASGDIAGIAYATPASGTQGAILYAKGASDATDLWGIGVGGVSNAYAFQTESFRPGTDNVRYLGTSLYRWTEIFAATGTIATSDGREKQQVRPLSEAEHAVAVRLKSLVRAFKFNDAVQSKGDGARIHVGVIAQDVKAAFETEGLKAEDYALLCYDEWEEQPEIKDDSGTVIQEYRPAGSRYGVRYEELLAFIISAL